MTDTTAPAQAAAADAASTAAQQQAAAGATEQQAQAAAQQAAAQAARDQAAAQGIRLSDEDVERIAEAQANKTIAKLEQRGAFAEDTPPSSAGEQQAEQQTAPPAQTAPTPAQGASQDTGPVVPRRPTLAERFTGGRHH